MNDRFHLTRRKLLSTAAAAVLVPPVIDRGVHSARAATRGRVKQSICFWCFNSAGEKWDVETTCRIAKDLGCVSVELVDPLIERIATLLSNLMRKRTHELDRAANKD